MHGLDLAGLLVVGVEAVVYDPLCRGDSAVFFPALWCSDCGEAEAAACSFGHEVRVPPPFCCSPQETEEKKPDSFLSCGGSSFLLLGMAVVFQWQMVIAWSGCAVRRL